MCPRYVGLTNFHEVTQPCPAGSAYDPDWTLCYVLRDAKNTLDQGKGHCNLEHEGRVGEFYTDGQIEGFIGLIEEGGMLEGRERTMKKMHGGLETVVREERVGTAIKK